MDHAAYTEDSGNSADNSKHCGADSDVIILGAGMAGLSAACALAEAGRRPLVLEARSRLGGRICTDTTTGAPIELGAEFIHGRPPELLALLEKAGLAITEVEGEQFCYADGRLETCPDRPGLWRLMEMLQHTAARLAPGADMSFDRFLDSAGLEPEVHAEAAVEARQYIEGFNAADASVIGIVGLARQQVAEDAIEGHRAARPVEGYGALVQYLARRAEAAGARMRLGCPAGQVAWQPGRASVSTSGGEALRAPALLCTVPVGVLQAGAVHFTPEPAAAIAAAASLSAGAAQRVAVRFEQPWWERRAPGLGWLFARKQPLPVWWSSCHPGSAVLVGWLGGPAAGQVQDRETLEAVAAETLRSIFPGELPAGRGSFFFHNWLQDPWTLGAYSSVPAGAAAAPQVLATPVAGTLFFAGEHTDVTGHPGTVHGALRSGLRAAGQLLGRAVSL